jgi:hypothetical protein
MGKRQIFSKFLEARAMFRAFGLLAVLLLAGCSAGSVKRGKPQALVPPVIKEAAKPEPVKAVYRVPVWDAPSGITKLKPPGVRLQ